MTDDYDDLSVNSCLDWWERDEEGPGWDLDLAYDEGDFDPEDEDEDQDED